MAEELQLRVVTPTREAVNERVREVYAPGTLGELGILPDHATFLTSLEIGLLSFAGSAGSRRVAVREGFAEVSDNVVTVLTEAAVLDSDAEADRARADLDAATRRLRDLDPIDPEYASIDSDRRWAEARLSLAAS